MKKRLSKKKKEFAKIFSEQKKYTIKQALCILEKIKVFSKFNESVDVFIKLNINPKKTEQNIRGYSTLPHGNGKKKKIAVFSRENIKELKKIGANFVGMEDLVNLFKNNTIQVDLVLAKPDSMSIISQIGQILGPKGLMPNLKSGTLTNNLFESLKNFKKKQILYKNDKNGIIHTSIGKINFESYKIEENIRYFIQSIQKNKPNSVKGNFIKNFGLCTTMGPGIKIEMSDII
ncbi:50S ribosomal protein L1 [bacterium endosymbiont of Pedicinus badii]|uniref:50S ribosomal protein L1 n=1 Tax=bacterium endosymbiont of Pedicinus badii TaxID=1719126 RepID=UPI0009BA2967|nr:50S ribosomal protein L1 [bacterium endosymbiont of Pedicinus badii]OQM34043.1 hypothetical protein AOQ89_01630 [bacterium endosymbiont of Pedicinus badii]